jgi:hypothetical protein
MGMLTRRLLKYLVYWVLFLYRSERSFQRLSSSVTFERYVATGVLHGKRTAANPAGAGVPGGPFVSLREASSRKVRTEQR